MIIHTHSSLIHSSSITAANSTGAMYPIEFMINLPEKISEKIWALHIVWLKPDTGKVKKLCAVMCIVIVKKNGTMHNHRS